MFISCRKRQKSLCIKNNQNHILYLAHCKIDTFCAATLRSLKARSKQKIQQSAFGRWLSSNNWNHIHFFRTVSITLVDWFEEIFEFRVSKIQSLTIYQIDWGHIFPWTWIKLLYDFFEFPRFSFLILENYLIDYRVKRYFILIHWFCDIDYLRFNSLWNFRFIFLWNLWITISQLIKLFRQLIIFLF